MARKRKHEEHVNHERWLISYADFITLLFAFFVVMYSISSVNEGKYRVLSDSLISAFRQTPKAVEPIQVGQPAKSTAVPAVNFINRPNVLETPSVVTRPPRLSSEEQERMGRIADGLRRSLGRLVDQGLIAVRSNDLWLEVEIRDSVLFQSGSAALHPGARPVLESVVEVLRNFPNPIRVEGFTDDIPINTLIYPSNWELSTARASSVVRLFDQLGIAPGRMSALGYAEFRPVAGNETPTGRAQNRRVVLVVLADERLSWLLDGNGLEDGPPDAPASPAMPVSTEADGINALRANDEATHAPPPGEPVPMSMPDLIPDPMPLITRPESQDLSRLTAAPPDDKGSFVPDLPLSDPTRTFTMPVGIAPAPLTRPVLLTPAAAPP